MAELARIFGAEMSPYSVKVHSCFRYKEIPHRWVLRNADAQAEYESFAKLPHLAGGDARGRRPP